MSNYFEINDMLTGLTLEKNENDNEEKEETRYKLTELKKTKEKLQPAFLRDISFKDECAKEPENEVINKNPNPITNPSGVPILEQLSTRKYNRNSKQIGVTNIKPTGILGDANDLSKRMDNYTLFRETNKTIKKDKFVKTNELLNSREKIPNSLATAENFDFSFNKPNVKGKYDDVKDTNELLNSRELKPNFITSMHSTQFPIDTKNSKNKNNMDRHGNTKSDNDKTISYEVNNRDRDINAFFNMQKNNNSGSTRPDYNQIISERNMVPDYTLVKRSGVDDIDTDTPSQFNPGTRPLMMELPKSTRVISKQKKVIENKFLKNN
jgi:hypothetical protein